MPPEIRIPDLTWSDLRVAADGFLQKMSPENRIPVPIEEIAELRLGMDIIPIPGLMRHFEIDGFISSDFLSVTVDDDIYRNHQARYRFTLAHELAHSVLHRELYQAFAITSLEDFEAYQDVIGDRDYGIVEGQANRFAGLLLAPLNHLRPLFERAVQKAEKAGINVAKVGDMPCPILPKKLQQPCLSHH
jgi:hypothetical protein